MASREVIRVFLRELGEGVRRLATDPAYDVRDQFSCVLAVGRGYEGQFLGAPPGQAASDEFVAKGPWLRGFVGDLLPDGRTDRLGGGAIGKRLRSAHHVGRSDVCILGQGCRGHTRHVAYVHEGKSVVVHRGGEPPLRGYGGAEAKEVL